MRKIILIIVIVFSGVLIQAQTLKGITIGEVYQGDTIHNEWGGIIGEFNSTLGGIEGKMIIVVNDSKVVTTISFTSSDEVLEMGLSHVKDGLEKKFGITYIESDENSYFNIAGDIMYTVELKSNHLVVLVADSKLLRESLNKTKGYDDDDF